MVGEYEQVTAQPPVRLPIRVQNVQGEATQGGGLLDLLGPGMVQVLDDTVSQGVEVLGVLFGKLPATGHELDQGQTGILEGRPDRGAAVGDEEYLLHDAKWSEDHAPGKAERADITLPTG